MGRTSNRAGYRAGTVTVLVLVAACVVGTTAPAATASEFPTPTQPSNPVGIVQGSDGSLWFTEPTADKIGRVTPSGQFSEFPIPTANADPEQIALGSDGAVWFTETAANRIGRIPTNATPGSGAQITEYPIPMANSRPEGITSGADGALWFAESGVGRIGRIPTNATPGSGAQITEYVIPSSTGAPSPFAITGGPGGALWFTDVGTNTIGRIPATGAPITSYSIPTANSVPEGITRGPDGAVWFTESATAKIGRIPTTPGIASAIAEYRTPSVGPTAIVTAAIGATSQGPIAGLWFVEQGGEFSPAELTAFDPSTGAFSSTPLPARDIPAGVSGGPDDAIWYTDRGQSAVGRLATPSLGGPATATEGVPFTGTLATVFGSPTSASINWGDGVTTDGTITASGADSTVSGSHAYAEEGTQTAVVTAYYCSPPAPSCAGTVSSAVTVADAPLAATAADDPEPTVRQQFTATIATFTDPDQNATASDYSATIDWGDGTTTPADKVARDGNGFDVVGTHKYTRYGVKAAKVTITDAGGASTTATAEITPQVPLPPKCDPSDCPKGTPPPQGTPCPPGQYGVEPHCAPPTPSNCFPQSPVIGQNWTEGEPAIDGVNGRILSQALEFGPLVLVVTGDCWHYDGDSNATWQFGTGLQFAKDKQCQPPTCIPQNPVYGYFHTTGTVFVNGIAIQNECATIRVATTGEISADPYPSKCRTIVTRYIGTTLDRSSGHLPTGECLGVECVDRGESAGFLARAQLDSNPWVLDHGHLATLKADLEPGSGVGVGGFPLTGTLSISVPAEGHVHLDGNVQLPRAFSTGPDGAGGQPSAPIGLDEGYIETGSGPFAADLTHKAHVASTIPPLHYDDIWLGGLDIHNVDFSYDDSSQIWSASGDLYLVGIPLAGGAFRWGPSGFIGGSVSKTFNPPLLVATDVGIEGIKLALSVGPPTKISGSVSIEGGNGLATLDGGGFVVFATGAHQYIYQPNDIPGIGQLAIPHGPFDDTVIGLGGTVDVTVPGVGYRFPLADAYVLYSPGFFEFAGGVHFDFGPLTIDGGVAGVIGHLVTGGTGFDLQGFVHACAGWSSLSLCGDIEGIVSSIGAQVCFGDQGGEIYWSKGYPQPIFWDCDITGFVPPFGARDAAADGARTFRLPPRLPAAEIELIGEGGPPDVTLTGPNGETVPINYATQHPTTAGTALGAKLAGQDQTYIGIKQPEAGNWTVTPVAGAPAVTSLLIARGLPPARVTARVTGTGYKRTLRYRIKPRPDQRVVFYERGRQSFQVLGFGRGTAGTIAFSPALGPAGPRKIVAVIELNGLPVKNLPVTTYIAPGPPVPPPPEELRASIRGGTLRAHWRRSASARSYVVAVRSADGRNRGFSLGARVHTLRLGGYRAVGATVSVTGIGPAGNAGRAATAIVAPPALPARITGLTAHAQHRSVVIRWRSAARAARYRVTLRSGTGRRAKSDAFDVRKTSLKIHGLHAGARLRIKVQGESSAFGLGPSATTEVTAR